MTKRQHVISHALAGLAGIGGTVAVLLAPPVFHDDPPPETKGVTCHVEKTGVLTGEQVCEFGWVLPDDAAAPGTAPVAADAPDAPDAGTP